MQLNTMIISGKKFVSLYFAMVMACVAGDILLATVGVDQLHKATTHQCITHDWPADKAVTTSKWCVANGYKI